MDQPTPVELTRHDQQIEIVWSDGVRKLYRPGKLRAACPCATCREKHKSGEERATKQPTALPVLSLAEARPLAIESMRPVGNYAYNIAFSDGHDSGIFTFDFLYELGEASA